MFYFTNILENLQYVELGKGLEVCSILTDVYLSRYRNAKKCLVLRVFLKCGNRNTKSQVFGFACFSKVRDVYLSVVSILGCFTFMQMQHSLIGLAIKGGSWRIWMSMVMWRREKKCESWGRKHREMRRDFGEGGGKEGSWRRGKGML